MTPTIKLNLVTIAVSDSSRMAEFYSTLLATPFKPVDCGSFTLHVGQLPELEIQLCPKAVAGIAATQNIHQLRFAVPDLDRHLELALGAGGQAIDEVMAKGSYRLAAVRDPDGNSIELYQENHIIT